MSGYEWTPLGTHPSGSSVVRSNAVGGCTHHHPTIDPAGALAPATLPENRPLGAFLFSHPDLQRGDIEVTQLAYSTPPLNLLPQDENCQRESTWGRRSLFRLQGRPVLVSEIFLQSLLTD